MKKCIDKQYERKVNLSTGHHRLLKNFLLVCVFFFCICRVVFQVKAQRQELIQVRTVDEQLQPMKNIGISINGKEAIYTGNNGTAFVELTDRELPVKSITVKEDHLEVKAWNFSKSILEIVIRRKNHRFAPVVVKDRDDKPVADLPVTFRGTKTTAGKTDREGKIEILLAMDEKPSVAQFEAHSYEVTQIEQANGQYILTVTRNDELSASLQPDEKASAAVPKPITKEEYLKNFDFSKIDSIQSLTMFYAIFKNYEISSLETNIRKKVDAKFNELMGQLQDSLQYNAGEYMSRITDSSLVNNDIKNLLRQARVENLTLLFQRDQFDKKIALIDEKLKNGMVNLDEEARTSLYADILELERLLRENENLFYENMNYYREIIDSLKQKYFDVQTLENKLSASEAKLLEEQRIFRERLLGISAVILIFAILILLLIKFSNRLKKQKGALEMANNEVKRINENLEEIVLDRTKLLEESNRELDTFLYRASHDLRSPVCSIKGLCHIAANLSEGEPKEMVQRVVTITEKMDKLLTKLSIISEINRPTEYDEISFPSAVEKVLEKFKDTIEENQITFGIDCPENVVFSSNPRLVEVILSNLIENALYYGAMRKGETTHVELKAAIVNNRIEFSIQDYGVGINESIRHRLFEMFFKGHEASKGNGLGLYIVHKSVLSLKGTITVESEKGQYSKFVVQLPLKQSRKKTLSYA